MLQVVFLVSLVSLESFRRGGVHGLGSMTFALAVQKFLNYGMDFSLKIKFKL
jgi:hypothetical protein